VVDACPDSPAKNQLLLRVLQPLADVTGQVLGGELGTAELLGRLKQEGPGEQMPGKPFAPGVSAFGIAGGEQTPLSTFSRRYEPWLQGRASIALSRAALPLLQRDRGAQQEQIDVEYAKSTLAGDPQSFLGRAPGFAQAAGRLGALRPVRLAAGVRQGEAAAFP